VSHEVNFDGLVGPTHNYAGLSAGNKASADNARQVANPRAAARQGLQKMRLLTGLGLVQGVLPPQQRPDPDTIRRLGLDPRRPLEGVAQRFPDLLSVIMSASSMWAANAATVSPSTDTADGRVHLTPANLSSNAHRSMEATQTTNALRATFADPARFVVHEALPATALFADEGAANHGRVTAGHGEPGVHIFVHGRDGGDAVHGGKFPRRQARLAGELIANSHGLDPARVHHIRQAASAIDGGAFHNDVVAVINESVVFHHQDAFDDTEQLRAAIPEARFVEVGRKVVPLADAVSSYLFNSQLVTLPDRSLVLIAPGEVEQTPSAADYLRHAVADPDNPIDAVHAIDLRQSMRNGGGPACLRLRVVLRQDELDALDGSVIVDDSLLARLEAWVDTHYRSELAPDDLGDPDLVEETNRALDELTQILNLGSLYQFQR